MLLMMLSVGGAPPELIAETDAGKRYRIDALYRRASDSAVTPRAERVTLDALLGASDPAAAARWLENRLEEAPELSPSEEIEWELPLERGDLICVGRNYAEHARELGNEPPSEPVLFMKPRASLTAHDSPILLPKGSTRIDYEGELALVIGRALEGEVSDEQARDAIFGITLLNDVTDRAHQARLKEEGKPWLVAKGHRSFAPCGPKVLVLPREADLDEFTIETRLNGERVQTGSSSHWIFSAATLISKIAATIGLRPGDIISTGTPEGVGPLKDGDVVELSCDRIGILRNPVRAEDQGE